LGAQIKRAGAATDSIVGLAALFGGDFPGLLVPAKKGTGSRQRELPRVAVFWAFLGRVLMRGASCRWALTRLQADAVSRGRQPPGSGTGAYCQARRALPLPWLQALFAALARWSSPGPKPSGSVAPCGSPMARASPCRIPRRTANASPMPAGKKKAADFPRANSLAGFVCIPAG